MFCLPDMRALAVVTKDWHVLFHFLKRLVWDFGSKWKDVRFFASRAFIQKKKETKKRAYKVLTLSFHEFYVWNLCFCKTILLFENNKSIFPIWRQLFFGEFIHSWQILLTCYSTLRHNDVFRQNQKEWQILTNSH